MKNYQTYHLNSTKFICCLFISLKSLNSHNLLNIEKSTVCTIEFFKKKNALCYSTPKSPFACIWQVTNFFGSQSFIQKFKQNAYLIFEVNIFLKISTQT